ncbi:MAG: biotin/lipoyl-containing protein [Pseudomonadota bacterium]
MKMEVPYEAPVAGKLTALHIAEGDVVEEGQLAAELL